MSDKVKPVTPKISLFEFTVFKTLKANYSLYPIVFIALFGSSLAAFQITRSLLKSPDVHVNRRANPDPWNKYETDDGKYIQFKYFSTLDYKALSQNNEKPKIV